MINKLEQKVDGKFGEMGILPKVYHFREDVKPFTAITIVDTVQSWIDVRCILDALKLSWRTNFDTGERFFPVYGYFLGGLHRSYIYGVAFHEYYFYRQRGRIIAKGRLLKHLKEISK